MSRPIGMTLYFRVETAEAELRELAEKRRDLYQNYPGLLLKAFVYEPAEKLYGSHLLWESDEAARSFLASDIVRQMKERFGQEPVVRVFEVFAVVADRWGDPA